MLWKGAWVKLIHCWDIPNRLSGKLFSPETWPGRRWEHAQCPRYGAGAAPSASSSSLSARGSQTERGRDRRQQVRNAEHCLHWAWAGPVFSLSSKEGAWVRVGESGKSFWRCSPQAAAAALCLLLLPILWSRVESWGGWGCFWWNSCSVGCQGRAWPMSACSVPLSAFASAYIFGN